MNTDAAILVDTNAPLEVVRLELPSLKPGQVIVEVAYSGVCGTQLMEARGMKGEDKWLPHCMGHEGSGTVVEVGADVSRVSVGDQVAMSWLRAGGIDAGGAQYIWNGKNVNAGGVTTFQRHAVVSENRLTKLISGVSLRDAVALGCALPTGVGAVVNVLGLGKGNSMAILGCGGVGQCALIGAVLSGCAQIIAVDPVAAKRAMAMELGATHVIDPAAVDDVASAIREIAGNGVDGLVEASGHPEIMNIALAAVRAQGGRAVIVGNAPAGAVVSVSPNEFNQGKSLMGTWGGDSQPDRDYQGFMKWLAEDKVPVDKMFSAPFSLADINDALGHIEASKQGRPIIDMQLGS